MTPWTFAEARRKARESFNAWSQGWHNADVLIVMLCVAGLVATYYYFRTP